MTKQDFMTREEFIGMAKEANNTQEFNENFIKKMEVEAGVSRERCVKEIDHMWNTSSIKEMCSVYEARLIKGLDEKRTKDVEEAERLLYFQVHRLKKYAVSDFRDIVDSFLIPGENSKYYKELFKECWGDMVDKNLFIEIGCNTRNQEEFLDAYGTIIDDLLGLDDYMVEDHKHHPQYHYNITITAFDYMWSALTYEEKLEIIRKRAFLTSEERYLDCFSEQEDDYVV